MAKETVRVSYNELKKMTDVLDMMHVIEDPNKMNVLISYESVGGIGCDLEMTVEGAMVMGVKTNLNIPLTGVEDW